VASPAEIQEMEGCYWFNRAFYQFRWGNYGNARRNILQAFRKDPTYLFNRGAWATLVRASLSSLPAMNSLASAREKMHKTEKCTMAYLGQQ
jgi:hypothetical protein